MKNKGFISYSVRIGFWIMIISFLLNSLCFIFADNYYDFARDFTYGTIIISSIFTLIFSFILLFKIEEEREFAITSLILSFIIILLKFIPCSLFLPK